VRVGLTLLLVMAAGLLAAGEPDRQQLKFSHLRHEHAGCESCHVDHQRPAHPQCQKCHDRVSPPGREVRLQVPLKFSHRIHQETPDRCRSCHLPERDSGPTGMLPNAANCLACHQSLAGSGRCDACHPAYPDGRLVQGPGRKLVPRGGHGGENHDLGWKKEHGQVARARRASCRACHTVRSCDECHRGVLRRLEIHPPDWDLSHPGSARAGLQDCDGCHRDQSRCLGCHRQTGVAESSDLKPRNMRLHPEGYADAHAGDARRNLRACSACHAERDCIRCHGIMGIGQGVKPHPAGFRSRCRLFKSRNPRPCLKCHGQADLEVRCP